jgi:hypothetical protein
VADIIGVQRKLQLKCQVNDHKGETSSLYSAAAIRSSELKSTETASRKSIFLAFVL